MLIRGKDGSVVFVDGKTRITIVEHFPHSGKSVDELLSKLIRLKIGETIA